MDHCHLDYQSYLESLSLYGRTARERDIARAKEDFARSVVDNPAYQEDCLRNGAPQRFMITRTDTPYKCGITAFPGEELYPGDIITAFDEHWIVYQTRVANPIQATGVIWLCNHLFRWQNGTPEIVERWGVLDAGVYSTTKTGGYEVNTPDVQYKIYLPLDQDTRRLYVDKRIATNIRYDASGKEILEVYKLTRVDPTSQAYGRGAHLLLLHARSDDYIAEHDSLEERICGYIPTKQMEVPVPPAGPAEYLPCRISGRSVIRLGSSRTYTVDMDGRADPIWRIDPPLDGLSLEGSGVTAKLTAGEDTALVGSAIVLTVTDAARVYGDAQITVEVV